MDKLTVAAVVVIVGMGFMLAGSSKCLTPFVERPAPVLTGDFVAPGLLNFEFSPAVDVERAKS